MGRWLQMTRRSKAWKMAEQKNHLFHFHAFCSSLSLSRPLISVQSQSQYLTERARFVHFRKILFYCAFNNSLLWFSWQIEAWNHNGTHRPIHATTTTKSQLLLFYFYTSFFIIFCYSFILRWGLKCEESEEEIEGREREKKKTLVYIFWKW